MDKGCGGRIELRVFNIVIAGIKKSRQMVDANHALREWCGRAGGGGGPFLAMHVCFRNGDLGINGSGHYYRGKNCLCSVEIAIAGIEISINYTTQLMIQEWGGFPRNALRMNEEALNLFNEAAEGKKELRNFQIETSSVSDADCAVREWCGRAGGTIPRTAQSAELHFFK
jgi:hypothetical protein